MPEPDLARAIRHRIVMTGGGGSVMAHGRAWAFNGVAGHGHHMPPLFILPRDASCVFELVNDTAFPHPVHLHGFAFRVLSRNGRPPPRPEWRDTILVMAGERAEIGFVADNPGDWMLHCHIAEHMDGGMMNVVRVD
jgi:FtsP/CotA-like multicopper oxidase with cupredoxin domain